MQPRPRFTQEIGRPKIGHNLLWFAASLVLALMVWIVATMQADPISERAFSGIPVQIEPDAGLLVVGITPRPVTVLVRAQQSVLSLLTSQDITVHADLAGKGPGTYAVELDVQVARRAVADTRPRQTSVTLEEIQSRLVEVRPNIAQEPPLGFQREAPIFSDSQILVSGASSQVQEVAAVQVTLDLSQQRTTLEEDIPLTPVDSQGNIVAEVTLEPQSVQVTVQVTRREDVREVSITPNIDTGSLSEGYIITSLGYEPQTVFVSGNLTQIPDSLFTQRISLENRAEDFEIIVPVVLPGEGLLILGQQDITVSVGISALTITRQFENIPVTIIGLAEGLEAQPVTTQVTVLITGPQAELQMLEPDDLQVVLDLNSLLPDTYELTPVVSNSQGPLDLENVSVLPATIGVTITNPAQIVPTPNN
jgi:YbbR domain-containing protein